MEDISKRSLSMIRMFDAPVELLWKVLTTPEYIKDWWGPEGFTNTIHKMDVREGGRWLFTMHDPDGTDFKSDHTYKEIVTNELIVLENKESPEFEIVIKLIDKGQQTEIEWKVIFGSVPTMKEAIRAFKVDAGMKQNLERLAEHINQH